MAIYIFYLTCNCFLGGTTHRGFPHQTFFRSSEIRHIRVAITVEGKFWLLAECFIHFLHIMKLHVCSCNNSTHDYMRLTINMILS